MRSEGGASRDYRLTKALMYSDPGAWDALLGRLGTSGRPLSERPDRTPARRRCNCSIAGPAAWAKTIIAATCCRTPAG